MVSRNLQSKVKGGFVYIPALDWIPKIRASIGLVLLCQAPCAGADPLSLKAILAREGPAVVLIETHDEDGTENSQASGIVLSRDGLIVTNLHTLESACEVLVHTGGQAKESVVTGVTFGEDGHDLVILHVQGLRLTPATLGNSTTLSIGDKVVAIGNPMGLENSVSEGIVSGKRHLNGEELIQTTVPISPGSSGGGLYDSLGRLVGITTSTLRESQNLNFAIPVEQVQELLAKSTEKSSLVTWSIASSAFCGKETSSTDAMTVLGLIGRPLFDKAVSGLLTELNGGTMPQAEVHSWAEFGEVRYFRMRRAGLQIIFGDGTASQVIFYLRPWQFGVDKKGKPFTGRLPFGLQAGSTRADVLQRFGTPLHPREKGNPDTSDVFVIGDKRYFFQYTGEDAVDELEVMLR